jgi:hypothetical protein
MRVQLSLLLLAATGAALAGSFGLSGRMSEVTPAYSFEFSAGTAPTRFFFELPYRARLGVTVRRGSEVIISRVLGGTGPLTLDSAGQFTITVARDTGDGAWACRLISDDEVVLRKVTGYAGPGCSPRFSLHVPGEDAVWNFTYPVEALFYVRQIDGGRVVDEQDLYDDTRVQLIGEGVHTLEVAAPDTTGEFTATLVR